jgi:hypothetical protein
MNSIELYKKSNTQTQHWTPGCMVRNKKGKHIHPRTHESIESTQQQSCVFSCPPHLQLLQGTRNSLQLHWDPNSAIAPAGSLRSSTDRQEHNGCQECVSRGWGGGQARLQVQELPGEGGPGAGRHDLQFREEQPVC